MNGHRCGQFRFEHQRKAYLSIDTLGGIALIIVDTSLHHPLQVVRGEASCFVEQLVDVLVGSEGTELQVVQCDLLEGQQTEQRVKQFFLFLGGLFL